MGELDDILHGLEPSLGSVGAPPVPLEGGITNRNYRISFASGDYVLRLHGKDTALLGISRDDELLANRAAARLRIAPEVAASFEGGLVTRFVQCEPMQPADVAGEAEQIARSLRAFHDSGVQLAGRFWVPDLLDGYERAMARRGETPPASWGRAREIAARVAAALPLSDPRPCHNDLLPGNLLRESEGRVMLVDWEYAAMGHPCFDLGNLSVNNEFEEPDDERLLAAYHGAQPTRPQRAALELMRVLSDAREAAWGSMQAGVSDLDFDFEGYAERHFRRLRAAAAGRRFDDWLAAVG